VVDRGDGRLGAAARSALTKIAAVLPDDLRNALDASSLLVGPGAAIQAGNAGLLPQIRQAIRSERKLEIHYRDLQDIESSRTIWPFAFGYFDCVHVLVAWCELRQRFRHFRADRIFALKITEERYPRRRQALLKAWREIEGIPPQ
jgi:predicted DNA-binding transcriptional regulator YafY